MPSTSPQDIGERRAAAHAGRPLRDVLMAVAVFYVSASLLNGRFLHEGASEREYGTVRDLWVAATRPLADISEFLHLDAVRAKVETLRKE